MNYKTYRTLHPLPKSASPLEAWVGKRVRIKPRPATRFDEALPEERGVVFEYQHETNPPMFTVEVDARYRSGDDDGLREVECEEVELLSMKLTREEGRR